VKALEEVRDTELYRELKLLHDQGIKKVDASSLSGAIRGRARIYDQLESMLRNAQKSITLVTTAKGLVRKYEILKPILKKNKNIKVRILTNINKDNKEMVDELRKYAEIKNMDKVNSRYCIIDSKEILFMMLDDEKVHESYDTAVWVDTSYFASALENLFNLHWNNLKE
ncbi:MAG: TrmB family transcriptional regulator sugar-binding domain-containing protein, partial [Nanoarchaeota archaeon]